MKKCNVQVLPSILAADFSCLKDELKRIEEAGADALHLDIMDGHFVPNISFGSDIVKAIKRNTKLFLDVHIMAYNSFDLVDSLVRSGAQRITFHFESTEDIEDTLIYIKRSNIEVGLAFNPETSIDFVEKYIAYCDLVLLMTVNPGCCGQPFIDDVVDKIKTLKSICDHKGIRVGLNKNSENSKESVIKIQVDGGINDVTAALCVEAGANVLVAGSYLFKGQDMAEKILKLRNCGK